MSPTSEMAQFDSCVCGDYRKDHSGRGGACAYNQPNVGHHGAPDCDEFRLSRTATEVPKFYRRVRP